jgi:protein-S-isoprenylcysteine O-methyltransferase Ste14
MVRLGNFFYRTRLYVFPLACLLVFLPGPHIFTDDLVAALAGFLVALAWQFVRAGTIGLVYIIRGGKNRQVYAEDLVTEGVFAHSRNPMYVGNLLILSGMAITSNTWTTVLVAIPVTAFIYRAIVAAEEDYLSRQFGEAYAAYCRRVNRWLPDLRGFSQSTAGMPFDWQRVVTKEYGTFFAALAALLIIQVWTRLGEDGLSRGGWIWVGVLATLLLGGYVSARVVKKQRLFHGSAHR